MRKMPLRKAPSLLLEVLEAVSAGLIIAQFARERGLSRKQAWRLFTRAERQGFIRSDGRSSFRLWSLTRDGADLRQVLKTSLKNAPFKPKFRYEHAIFACVLRETPPEFKDKLKAGGFVFSKRRHYEGLQLKSAEATVFVSPSSVWVMPKPIWAECEVVAWNRALELTLAIVRSFEARYGVRVGYPERKAVLKRQEVAMVAPELLKFVPEGYYWRGDRLHIDHSYGDAELETHDRAFAVEDMNARVMPFLDSIAKGTLTAEDLRTLAEFAASLRAVPRAGFERRDVA